MRNKAAKLPEAKNAAAIHEIIKSRISGDGFWYWMNPINQVVQSVVAIPQAIADGITGKSGENTAYDSIRGLLIQDKKELIKAYHGLFNRKLSEDLKESIGDENFAKLDASWNITDIENTGYKITENKYLVKEGKKIVQYTPGYYSEYENKYALIISDGSGFYVNPSSTNAVQLKPIKFKRGNYAGQATGFKLGVSTYKGGIIFKDKATNIVGIYLNATINGVKTILAAPIVNTLLFDSLNDMNDYAYSKGINISSVKI